MKKPNSKKKAIQGKFHNPRPTLKLLKRRGISSVCAMKSMNQCESTAIESAIPHVLLFNIQKTKNTRKAITKLLDKECVKGTYSIDVLKKGL